MIYQFLQTANNTADQASYTFSSQNLGVANAERYIIATIHSRKAGAAMTIDSVTIGGVSASIVVQKTNTVVNSNVVAIAIAKVPTGTTGDVVVNLSTTVLRCAINLYRAVGIIPTAFDSDESGATNPAVTLDVPRGGLVIGAGVDTNAATWTGLTEDIDATVETFLTHTAASRLFSEAVQGHAIEINYGGGTTEQQGVFVSFAPKLSPFPAHFQT